MRKTQRCPKCQYNRILLIATVPDTGEFASEIRHLHVAEVAGAPGFFGGERSDRAGKLNAAVCRKCGFTEFFVEDPESIPVDGVKVRELIGPVSEGPHR